MSFINNSVCPKCKAEYAYGNESFPKTYRNAVIFTLYSGLLVGIFSYIRISFCVLFLVSLVWYFAHAYKSVRGNFPFCFPCRQKTYIPSCTHLQEGDALAGLNIIFVAIISVIYGRATNNIDKQFVQDFVIFILIPPLLFILINVLVMVFYFFCKNILPEDEDILREEYSIKAEELFNNAKIIMPKLPVESEKANS